MQPKGWVIIPKRRVIIPKRVGYHAQKVGYHTQKGGLPYHSHRTNPHHRRQETTAPAVFLVRAILTRAVKTRCHVDHVGQAPLNPIK